ncbi:GGDEF domain-containing protein [Geminicoccus roseus]|uniref:GGDEF domain-containing protein n=1 Tax=Geminicoccus roseus TaxID=404900 RepID=UPI00146FA3A1|nr:GGDEF domain-containing protein [Geminicoccus roseus]
MSTLHRLGLPALPASYCIMFAYHAGQFPDLEREVRAMLVDPSLATNWRCEAIYDRFLGSERMLADYNEAIMELGRGVAEIGELLSRTTHHAERFGEIASNLSEAAHATSGATRRIIERAASQLASLAEEDAKLRREVAAHVEASTRSIVRAGKRFEAERQASRTDPLTKIGNRRRLDEAMAERVEASLVLADIDHFKRFNDTYGHRAGDLILVAFARILRQVTGERGLTIRFGGEEFAIFLPNSGLAEARDLADQARLTLEQMASITMKDGKSLSKVTASFGVASGRFDKNPDLLIERADRALYQAKNAGRNRVAVAPPPG